MEPNRLEQEFRDKLEQRTIEPSKMAWDRLDAMLSVGEEKEEKKVVAIKPNRSWMYIAASFVVFATIGTFFLTREAGNGNGTENNTTSVVTTENTGKQVEPEGTNTVLPATAQPATENIAVPKMKQEAVAATQTTKASATGRPVKSQGTANHRVVNENNDIIIQPANNESVAAVTHEGLKEDVIKDFEADKLLIASTGNTPKKKPSIKVNASSLLSSVEGELDESFRDKALEGVVKNFNAVKSSVANRNYQ